MHDIDRVAHVQGLPEPAWRQGLSVQVKPVSFVSRPKDFDRIVGYVRGQHELGQETAVRTSELELAIR